MTTEIIIAFICLVLISLNVKGSVLFMRQVALLHFVFKKILIHSIFLQKQVMIF